MLLWALYPETPQGYYILLRVVLCAIGIYLALRALEINPLSPPCIPPNPGFRDLSAKSKFLAAPALRSGPKAGSGAYPKSKVLAASNSYFCAH